MAVYLKLFPLLLSLPSPHPSLILSILVGLDLNVRRVVRTRLLDLDLDMVILLLLDGHLLDDRQGSLVDSGLNLLRVTY